jgi:hypothetical protein
MTGSHQHLRSYAARTLHRGVDHVDATLRTLASSRTMERGPGPFCPTVDVGGRPTYVCVSCMLLLVVVGVCLLFLHVEFRVLLFNRYFYLKKETRARLLGGGVCAQHGVGRIGADSACLRGAPVVARPDQRAHVADTALDGPGCEFDSTYRSLRRRIFSCCAPTPVRHDRPKVGEPRRESSGSSFQKARPMCA